MTTYKGIEGKQYQLVSKPFASGGEGDIFVITDVPDLVVKLYHQDSITPDLEKKLTFMLKNPPDKSVLNQIAWPLDILYDRNKKFCGFAMKKLSITNELGQIYNYPPEEQSPTVEQKLVIAHNIALVITEVHKAGYVFGDFNPCNIGVNMQDGIVSFFDTDSYQFIDKDSQTPYKCIVAADGYVAPELLDRLDREGVINYADVS